MVKSKLYICASILCGLAAAPAFAQGSSETFDVTPKTVEPDAPVGSYKQPQWTAARPFTQSRVYVLPQGEVEVEAWAKIQQFHDSQHNETLLQQEVEYGFARHLQFDVYVNQINSYNDAKEKHTWDLEGYQLELRWALADWGEIWGNPTLYFEYHPVKNNPERAEFRLLLGDTLAPNWHWAFNAGYEQDLWGKMENGQPQQEVPVSFGISTTALAKTFSVGAELKSEWAHEPGAQEKGKWTQEVDIGPSFQWRPCSNFHLDYAPLFGVKDVEHNTSPRTEHWIIAGIGF